jgi:phosphoribosylglycinamide formyltransferase-1
MGSTRPLRIAVLGSGKGSNCQSIIEAIEAETLHARIVCVLSDVKDAYILQRAAKHGIPAEYVDASPFKTKLDGEGEARCIAALRRYDAEVVVLAGFMRIVKPGLLRAFPQRILNIHPSLLPAFPGLEAWKQALAYGVRVTGCTVHIVDGGTDTGPIIVQRAVPVLPGDTPETLHARIQVEEHQAYPEALRMLASGRLRVDGRCVRLAE